MNVRSVLPKDAIQSIDDPAFDDSHVDDPDDEVVVVEASVPRAYPLRILNYHEIVNDVVDGDPVAVTWCPLCASAVVYERRVDGRELTFGVSGKLADDDLVMYDRETGSEWKQSRGEAIAGELAGTTLRALPAAIVPWERFRADHPDGVVLQPAAGGGGDADRTAYDDDPYREYFEGEGFGLDARHGRESGRSWDREDLDPKTVVLGVVADGEAVGYPLPRIRANGGVVEDEVGGRSVVVFATPDGVHAFENPGYAFEPVDDGTARVDGTTWDGATGASDDGRRLERLPARRLFAFAWQDDHGPDAFYGG